MEKNSHNSHGKQPVDVPERIFSELANYVLQSASVKWRPQLSSLRVDLYDGTSGLALFLAAYYRVTKDPRAHKAALQSLLPLRTRVDHLLANPDSMRAGAVPIGGLIGIGSFLYGLATVADWLNAPDLLESASALVAAITPDLIVADRTLDVMRGCAGTLLALMSFARMARARGLPWQPALNLSILCGQHLLRSRVFINDLKTWPLTEGLPQAGFIHGVTGISCALTHLYQETKEEEFRKAAYEGFCSEQALYALEHPGWRDRHSNQISESGCWCHGAAGIAMGRLSYIESVDEPAIRRNFEDALRLTRTLPLALADQLCCGNFGRIEVLYTVGMALDRLHLSERALDLTKHMLQQRSGFRFSPPRHAELESYSHSFNPSLFLGLAGVGYTLLRQKHADLLPSVLLLEAYG